MTTESPGDVVLVANPLLGTTFCRIESIETREGVVTAYHVTVLGSNDPAQRIERGQVAAIFPNLIAREK